MPVFGCCQNVSIYIYYVSAVHSHTRECMDGFTDLTLKKDIADLEISRKLAMVTFNWEMVAKCEGNAGIFEFQGKKPNTYMTCVVISLPGKCAGINSSTCSGIGGDTCLDGIVTISYLAKVNKILCMCTALSLSRTVSI